MPGQYYRQLRKRAPPMMEIGRANDDRVLLQFGINEER